MVATGFWVELAVMEFICGCLLIGYIVGVVSELRDFPERIYRQSQTAPAQTSTSTRASCFDLSPSAMARAGGKVYFLMRRAGVALSLLLCVYFVDSNALTVYPLWLCLVLANLIPVLLLECATLVVLFAIEPLIKSVLLNQGAAPLLRRLFVGTMAMNVLLALAAIVVPTVTTIHFDPRLMAGFLFFSVLYAALWLVTWIFCLVKLRVTFGASHAAGDTLQKLQRFERLSYASWTMLVLAIVYGTSLAYSVLTSTALAVRDGERFSLTYNTSEYISTVILIVGYWYTSRARRVTPATAVLVEPARLPATVDPASSGGLSEAG